jgi:hypothetical protein
MRAFGAVVVALLLCLSGCKSKDAANGDAGKAASTPSFMKLAMAVDGGRTDADGIVHDAKTIIDVPAFPAQFADISPMQGNSSAAAQNLVEAVGRSVKKLVSAGKSVDGRKMCRAGVLITKQIAARGPEILAAKAPKEPTEEQKALRATNLHAFKIWCMSSILQQLRDLKVTSSVQLAQQALDAEKSRSEQLETLVASKEYKRILAEYSGPTQIDTVLDTVEQALR